MPQSAGELQQQLVSRMSVEEKLQASAALRTAAWELKAAWIRSQQPDLGETEVQDAVRRWFRDAGA